MKDLYDCAAIVVVACVRALADARAQNAAYECFSIAGTWWPASRGWVRSSAR
ncbi:MAG TPA: hypothetical protein VIX73_17145 [Kofleriaceae bacterium]